MAATNADGTEDTLGHRIRAARKNTGLSVEKLRDRVLTLVPARYVPGVKTFYRLEDGEVDEAKVDGILIIGIANALGVRISEISSAVADEHEKVGDLLASSSRWITTRCEGQLVLLDLAS